MGPKKALEDLTAAPQSAVEINYVWHGTRYEPWDCTIITFEGGTNEFKGSASGVGHGIGSTQPDALSRAIDTYLPLAPAA